jgi:hypothetical protein
MLAVSLPGADVGAQSLMCLGLAGAQKLLKFHFSYEYN